MFATTVQKHFHGIPLVNMQRFPALSLDVLFFLKWNKFAIMNFINSLLGGNTSPVLTVISNVLFLRLLKNNSLSFSRFQQHANSEVQSSRNSCILHYC